MARSHGLPHPVEHAQTGVDRLVDGGQQAGGGMADVRGTVTPGVAFQGSPEGAGAGRLLVVDEHRYVARASDARRRPGGIDGGRRTLVESFEAGIDGDADQVGDGARPHVGPGAQPGHRQAPQP